MGPHGPSWPPRPDTSFPVFPPNLLRANGRASGCNASGLHTSSFQLPPPCPGDRGEWRTGMWLTTVEWPRAIISRQCVLLLVKRRTLRNRRSAVGLLGTSRLPIPAGFGFQKHLVGLAQSGLLPAAPCAGAWGARPRSAYHQLRWYYSIPRLRKRLLTFWQTLPDVEIRMLFLELT